jgi:archaeosine synthase beta-subunit
LTPYAVSLEEERSADGKIGSVATVFLTNHECPWRCIYCDLWKNTLAERTPPGAIPKQIDHALLSLSGSAPTVIKLYNAGSFFDAAAIPTEDIPTIAARVSRFDRVIVECHPALVGDRVLAFWDLLLSRNPAVRLEVAMGLETVHPVVLPKLNKRMTLDQFKSAAGFLGSHDIALRTFVLVQPPFLGNDDPVEWAVRSADFAFDCGADVVSLIPTRAGNGAMEDLAAAGLFQPPTLRTLERSHDACLGLQRSRVFADLWDLEKFSSCNVCFHQRAARLQAANLRQQVLPRITCNACADHDGSL